MLAFGIPNRLGVIVTKFLGLYNPLTSSIDLFPNCPPLRKEDFAILVILLQNTSENVFPKLLLFQKPIFIKFPEKRIFT